MDIGLKVVLICAGFMAICVVLGMIGKKLAERLGVPYYDKELVNEVALECGFNDVKLFRKYFKDEFGRLPSDYHK